MENHTSNRPQNMTTCNRNQEEIITTHLYGVLIVKEDKHFFLVDQRNNQEEYHGMRQPTTGEIEIFAIAN